MLHSHGLHWDECTCLNKDNNEDKEKIIKKKIKGDMK